MRKATLGAVRISLAGTEGSGGAAFEPLVDAVVESLASGADGFDSDVALGAGALGNAEVLGAAEGAALAADAGGTGAGAEAPGIGELLAGGALALPPPHPDATLAKATTTLTSE